MRNLTLAALAAFTIFVAGCQDTEARLQNAKLQAELDAMKTKPADDNFTKWLATQKGGGDMEEVNRKLTSISGDLAAGLKNLEKNQEDAAKSQSKRTDDLETKLKKVDELQSSLLTLKTMIETLESKIKNVDPNQFLELQKKQLETESSLRAEQDARKRLEADLKASQDREAAQKSLVEKVQGELAELKAGTSGEALKKLREQKADAEMERDAARKEAANAKTDRDNMKKQYDDLLKQVAGKGDVPKQPDVKDPSDDGKGAYTFEGVVAAVQGGGKPGEAASVLVNPGKGEMPPEGSEMLVLDEKKERVCRIRVIRLYYKGGEVSGGVEQIGCNTIDQKSENPVVKGYRVVWVKAAEEQPKDGGASGK